MPKLNGMCQPEVGRVRPSVQSLVPTRVYKHCGSYFASSVILKEHIIAAPKQSGMCHPIVGGDKTASWSCSRKMRN